MITSLLRYDEEAPTEVAGTKPPPGWPHAGAIEARNLTVKYRPELEPVLKGLRWAG
jgi:ATP-binding cassette subfamily C (CFTR/MRP) protein 1